MEPAGLFVDEAQLDGLTVRTIHRAERVGPARTAITYRMEITVPAADTVGAEVRAEMSGDFPETLARLVARAESP